MTTVIFVHGTGVQAKNYEQSFAQIKQELLKRQVDLTILPCYWGQFGTQLKELMAQLVNQPENEWPPNMNTVRKQLSQRFTALRQAGQSEQTPTHFYYKDWYSNESIDEMWDQNHVQTPIPEEQVLELLECLSITQFKKVLLLYKIPKSEIPPAGTRGEQNLALFEYAYQKEGEQLTNLVNLIYKIAPHLQRGDV